jgi:hypothetical protein
MQPPTLNPYTSDRKIVWQALFAPATSFERASELVHDKALRIAERAIAEANRKFFNL